MFASYLKFGTQFAKQSTLKNIIIVRLLLT